LLRHPLRGQPSSVDSDSTSRGRVVERSPPVDTGVNPASGDSGEELSCPNRYVLPWNPHGRPRHPGTGRSTARFASAMREETTGDGGWFALPQSPCAATEERRMLGSSLTGLAAPRPRRAAWAWPGEVYRPGFRVAAAECGNRSVEVVARRCRGGLSRAIAIALLPCSPTHVERSKLLGNHDHRDLLDFPDTLPRRFGRER